MSAEAALTYWDRAPPYALVALASMAGVPLELKPDPKAGKDAPPTLRLASGCVGHASRAIACFPQRARRSPDAHPSNSPPKTTHNPNHNRARNSDELPGAASVARYLLRASPDRAAAARLAASGDALAATRVDAWLDYAFAAAAPTPLAPGPGFLAAARSLDDYLRPRSFLVGRGLTAADVAVWGALAASPVFPKARRGDGGGGGAAKPTSAPLPHLGRWFDLVASQPACAAALDAHDPRRRQQAADAAAVAAGGRAKADGGSFDVELPGDPRRGAVVVRFPPEPSGYLHIGHAKAALLNQAVAERYEGELRVRFDDTNPSKEKDEYVENILKDMRDLGIYDDGGAREGGEGGHADGGGGGGGGGAKNDGANGGGKKKKPQQQRITYASDYFPQLAECAERLIDAGVLYADDTPVDQMREERMAGVESRCRDRPAAETRAIFAAMQRGEAAGVVLRLKIDMKSANTAMRDPVAYRVNTEVPHWRTGTKYKVGFFCFVFFFFFFAGGALECDDPTATTTLAKKQRR
jgi:glutamyl-tRNA synthetase